MKFRLVEDFSNYDDEYIEYDQIEITVYGDQYTDEEGLPANDWEESKRDVYFAYKTTKGEVAEALADIILDKKDSDLDGEALDKYIEDNYEELYNKYIEELKDYFRDSATEEAQKYYMD